MSLKRGPIQSALLPLSEKLCSLIRGSALFVFLDYDGTLTPIVKDPPKAEIQPAQRKIIKDLSECSNVRVAVVSGRSLVDIKKKIDITPLIYIGNHGLEYEGPFMKHTHPIASDHEEIVRAIYSQLRQVFNGIQGIWVEDKTLTLSVHYRNLEESRVTQARELLYAVVSPYLKSRDVMIRQGKKVWEIRPMVDWDKGKMVMWTLARFMARSPAKILPLCFGDDETDEDVFQVLRNNGITVRITRNPEEPSFAEYYLNSPDEVYEVLHKIKEMRGNGQ